MEVESDNSMVVEVLVMVEVEIGNNREVTSLVVVVICKHK